MSRNWKFASGEKWWYSVVAVASLLAVAIAMGSTACGGEVEYSVTGLDAGPVNNSVTGLGTAIVDINTLVDDPGESTNAATVTITIDGARTASGAVDNSAMWDFDAANGYKDIAITGAGTGQNLNGPTGGDYRALMRINDVSDTIDISKMGFVGGGKKNDADTADTAGAGLYIDGKSPLTTVNLTDTKFSGNSISAGAGAATRGGAAYSAGGANTVSNSLFTGNSAASTVGIASGGAFHYDGTGTLASLIIDAGSTFGGATEAEGNIAKGADAYGGAVFSAGGNNIVTDSTFSYNKADATDTAWGGAYYLDSDSASLLGNTFANNTASGATTASGGAVYAAGGTALTITNNGASSSFTNNAAIGGNAYGGAVHAAGDLTIEIGGASTDVNSFTGNTAGKAGGASGNGGAIYAEGDSASISKANFTSNKAVGANAYGGAISSVATAANVSDSEFSANSATGTNYAYGGAIANSNGDLTVTDVSFDGNSATGDAARGGAIYNFDGDLKIVSTGSNSFTNNLATGESLALGAGVYSFTGNVVITGETFTGQVATATAGQAYGGAVAVQDGTLALTGSTFVNNQAIAGGTGTDQGEAFGGALFIANDITAITMANNTFTNNLAKGDVLAYGGAIVNAGNEQVVLTGSSLTGNKAIGASTSVGGAVSSLGGYSQTGGELSGNSAGAADATTGSAYGGAIASEGNVTLTDIAHITGNSANGATGLGGVVFMSTINSNASTALNLAATDADMKVSGNTASGMKEGGSTLFKDAAFFFGNEIADDSTSHAEFNATAAAERTLSILDATGVDMSGGKNFTFKTDGDGTVELGGANAYRTAGGLTTLNFGADKTILTSDYSATFLGASDAEVNLKDDSTLTIALSRDNSSQALFDFQNDEGYARSLNVGTGVTLDATIDGKADYRPVRSFSAEYILASGLDKATADAAIANLDIGKTLGYVQLNDLKTQQGADGYSIVSGAQFDSPFERAGGNTRRALDAIDQLVNANPQIVGDNAYYAMLANPNALTADLYVAQAQVMVNAVDLTANNALDKALRHPHHAAIRLGGVAGVSGNGYANVPATRVSNRSAYGNGGGRVATNARETYYAANYPVGFRIWGGYVGDYSRNKSKGGYNGYNAERNGFLIGLNYDFGSAGSLGFYGGYSYAETRDRTVDARIKQDTGHFGLTGRISPIATLPNLSFYADAGYHFSRSKANKQYGLNGASYSSSGKFDQGVFTVGGAVDYMICLGGFNLIPFAKFRYSYLDQDSLNERGTAPTTMHIGGLHKNALTHRLGTEASYDFRVGSGIITPAIDIAWKHQWGSRRYDAGGYYNRVALPVTFRTSTRRLARDSIDLGLSTRAAFDIGGGKQAGGEVGVNLNLADKSHTTSVYVGGFLSF